MLSVPVGDCAFWVVEGLGAALQMEEELIPLPVPMHMKRNRSRKKQDPNSG